MPLSFVVVSNTTFCYKKKINGFFVLVNQRLKCERIFMTQSSFALQGNGGYRLKFSVDLTNFLEQDDRWKSVVEIYRKIRKDLTVLNVLWRRLAKRLDLYHYLSSDAHCLKVMPVHDINWQLPHLSISQGVDWKELKLDEMSYDGKLQVPYCKKISSLDFSIYTFDHLPVSIPCFN